MPNTPPQKAKDRITREQFDELRGKERMTLGEGMTVISYIEQLEADLKAMEIEKLRMEMYWLEERGGPDEYEPIRAKLKELEGEG